jgi:hypothetical protein
MSSKLGEVGSRSLVVTGKEPAMRGEGEVASPWRPMAVNLKEAIQTAERILKLKREMKALMALRRPYSSGGTAGKEEEEPQPATATAATATAREEEEEVEEARPAGAEKEKARVVVKRRRVPQQLIDYMIENPHDPWNGYPQERLLKRSQNFRDYYAREKAFHDKVLEYEQALVKQYHDKGFAEDYIEVSDNGDNN